MTDRPAPCPTVAPPVRRGPPRRGYVRVGTLDLTAEVYAEVAAEATEKGYDPIDLVEQLCAELALRRRLAASSDGG